MYGRREGSRRCKDVGCSGVAERYWQFGWCVGIGRDVRLKRGFGSGRCVGVGLCGGVRMFGVAGKCLVLACKKL